MTTNDRKPRWSFYPGWIALSAISGPLAWWIAWLLISQIQRVVGSTVQVGGQSRITEDFLLGTILLPLFGLLTGLLQALLLRRTLPRMGWWIVATVLGWLLPFAVLRLLSVLLAPVLDVNSTQARMLLGMLIGGSMGLMQWLVLRPRVPNAAWWILASVLGWTTTALVTGETLSSTLDMLAVVLLPPIATGFALWLLLDRFQEQRTGTELS